MQNLKTINEDVDMCIWTYNKTFRGHLWVHFKIFTFKIGQELDTRRFSKWEDDWKRREEITEIYGLFDDDYAFNFMKKSGKMNCLLKHHLQISVPPKAKKCDLL